MILLTLSRGKGEETVRLQLPASPAEIGETFAFLDRISLDTTATAILDVSSNVPVLYCWQHGGSITEDRRSYGYIAETENYRFCLRCTPFPGEYQGYLYCYDLCQQEMYRQEHPVVLR